MLIVKNGLFGEFWIEYLLPWVIGCAEPPFIGVFVHDHDEAVVPDIWHWIVYETSPTMAVPEGGLIVIEIGSVK